MSDRSVSTVGLWSNARILLANYFSVPSDLSKSGIQLFLLGTAVAALRKVAQFLLSLLDRTFITRSEIDSRDEAYHYLTTYLAQSKRDALHFTVSSQNKGSSPLDSTSDGIDGSPLYWIPAPGIHLLFFQSRPILVRRCLNGEARQTNLMKPSERLETMSLATFAISPHILHSLIEYARTMSLRKDRSRTVRLIPTALV